MSDFLTRQRLSMSDFNRSAFSPKPPCLSREAKRLDEIAAEAAKARQQSESIRQMNAEMSSLIEHAKAGEFRETDAGS